MAACFLLGPGPCEGGAVVSPGVDSVIIPGGDDVQVAIPVQVPHCHRGHGVIRMAPHFLPSPGIIKGSAVVLPGIDLVIPPTGYDIQVAVPVQVPYRHRLHVVCMAAHFL